MKSLVFILVLTASTSVLSDTPAANEGATPFYVWHDEITQAPGTLLRQEPLEETLVLKNAAKGIRILYASLGWNDQPVAVSGEILLPKGEAPKDGWPVLAWSHGTLGVADNCAASFNGRSERDTKYHNKWLAEG